MEAATLQRSDIREAVLGWPLSHAPDAIAGVDLGWPGAPVSRETVSDDDVSRETTDPVNATEPMEASDLGDDLSGPAEDPAEPAEALAEAEDDPAPAPQNLITLRPLPKPKHTRVVTVANQKGGVGKTTTTVNLAAALSLSGANVLVLDCDPQGNASTALGVEHDAEVMSIYDVLVESEPLSAVVQEAPALPNLWCAPATIHLAGAEIELVSMVAREMRLQRALEEYMTEREDAGLPQLDYVLIDCPPSLGLLTVNAFVAGTEVLIPIQCEYYALEGLSQLLNHVELIRKHLNPKLRVSTILLTMFDARTRLSAQVADEVRSHFTELVLRGSIPRSVRISEAPSYAQTVMTYDPNSSGALSYLAAAREIAHRDPAVTAQHTATGTDAAHLERNAR